VEHFETIEMSTKPSCWRTQWHFPCSWYR